MKNALTIFALGLVALVSSVQPAQANIWDWMQEWSGPGRFRGKVNGTLTACSKDFSGKHWYWFEWDKTPCVFFDVHAFAAKAKPSFQANASTTFIEAGPTWRVMRPLELGIGVGFMTASATKATTRLTFSGRIAAKPVLLIAEVIHPPKLQPYYDSESHWYTRVALNAPKIYYKYNVIVGPLSGDDLGVGGTSFDTKGDHFGSWGLMFDVGALFPRHWSGLM